MHIYSIYKATNLLNNKSYIGFTSKFHERKLRHFRKNSCSKFYRAIQKYGCDAFEWTILYQSLDRDHTLNEMEEYFIQLYDSRENGYNICRGGRAVNLGKKLSEETKHKMSLAAKGKKKSAEHIKALSQALKGRIGVKSMLGRKHSAERNKLMSEKMKGRKFSPETIEKMRIAARNRVKSSCRHNQILQSQLFARMNQA